MSILRYLICNSVLHLTFGDRVLLKDFFLIYALEYVNQKRELLFAEILLR